MARTVYMCRRCRKEIEPVMEGRSPVMLRGRVILACGHTARSFDIHVILDEADTAMSAEAEEAMLKRLESDEWRRS